MSPIVAVRGPVLPALNAPLEEQTSTGTITIRLLIMDTNIMTVNFGMYDTSGYLPKYVT
jgi:hypothetical protein